MPKKNGFNSSFSTNIASYFSVQETVSYEGCTTIAEKLLLFNAARLRCREEHEKQQGRVAMTKALACEALKEMRKASDAYRDKARDAVGSAGKKVAVQRMQLMEESLQDQSDSLMKFMQYALASKDRTALKYDEEDRVVNMFENMNLAEAAPRVLRILEKIVEEAKPRIEEFDKYFETIQDPVILQLIEESIEDLIHSKCLKMQLSGPKDDGFERAQQGPWPAIFSVYGLREVYVHVVSRGHLLYLVQAFNHAMFETPNE